MPSLDLCDIEYLLYLPTNQSSSIILSQIVLIAAETEEREQCHHYHQSDSTFSARLITNRKVTAYNNSSNNNAPITAFRELRAACSYVIDKLGTVNSVPAELCNCYVLYCHGIVFLTYYLTSSSCVLGEKRAAISRFNFLHNFPFLC